MQLEVLDWGGAGRPLVLLAGAGNTAHVFDEFAPRLASVSRAFSYLRGIETEKEGLVDLTGIEPVTS